MDMPENRRRQLVDVCIMHYEEGLTQQEISNKIGLSRPQISRLLAAARSAGIVKITIENPFSDEYRAEKKLQDLFGLKRACVVDAPEEEETTVLKQMTQRVAALFDEQLKEGGILGVMSGHTVYGISRELPGTSRKKLTVVSLSGGSEKQGNLQANNSAHYLADKFGCRFYPMQAPLVVANSHVRSILIQEREVAQTWALAGKATAALVGIGAVDENSPYFGPGLCDGSGLKALMERGATAGLGGSFLDKDGRLLPFPESERIIAVPAEMLRQIPFITAAAYGREKVKAISAVLKGRWIDALVTTLDTADALIREAE